MDNWTKGNCNIRDQIRVHCEVNIGIFEILIFDIRVVWVGLATYNYNWFYMKHHTNGTGANSNIREQIRANLELYISILETKIFGFGGGAIANSQF